MKTRKIEDTIYPVGIALSPGLVLARHKEVISKYGIDNFLKEQKFKRAREMYQTAVYALGTSARTGNYYWITPAKPIDETPDCYLIWVNGNELCVECVEITLWHEKVDEMWEIIKKKIDKKYPFHFSIVIHDSHGKEKVASRYYQELHEKLKDCSISAGAVRFWMEITNKKDRNVLIGELYPENTWTEFSSARVLEKYSLSPPIIRIDVTSNRRRMTFAHDDLNNITLPELPDI
jgi:hypothetical protein